jgi:hypothetical protein
MNRLLTPNGGMPFELDDLNFMQDAYKEGISALLSQFTTMSPHGLPATHIILSGCEVTPGATHFSVSAGYVMINNEPLYAPAVASVPNANLNNMFYRLHTYNDPAGNDLFEDGILRDTYEVRRAELVYLGSGVAYPIIQLNNPILRLKTLITHSEVYSYRDTAAEGTLDNGWTAVTFIGTSEPLLVTKQFGRVQVRGQVTGGAIAGDVVFTLSPEFRPKTTCQFLTVYGGISIGILTVNTNGTVTAFATSGSGALDLSCISFTTE